MESDINIISWGKSYVEKRVKYMPKVLGDKFLIEVVYSDSPDFLFVTDINTNRNDSYYLKVSTNVFPWIFHSIGLFLTDDNLFADVGKSFKLAKVQKFNTADYNEFSKYLTIGNLGIVDAERVKFQKFLFEVTLEFIVNHEYHHIYDGHIKFGEAVKKGKLQEKTLPPYVIKTLEIFADFEGISGTIFFIKEYILQSGYFRRGNDFEAIISCLMFVIIIFFSAFGVRIRTIRQYFHEDEARYPTSFQRIIICYYAICSILTPGNANSKQWWNETESSLTKYSSIFENIMQLTINARSKIFENWQEIEEGEWAEKLSNSFADFIEPAQEASRNWNTLFPILQSYAYHKLKPIQPPTED